ncbi:MAG: O-antigen ligase family protein [Candidatus Marinamargulisbacteria bacterium]
MLSKNNIGSSIFLGLNYTIIFGVTLIFSTATRSVFEVNKLGIFKICVALLAILFAYDRLLGSKTLFYSFKVNKWFNALLVGSWITNVLSTIFSQNILISMFGSYDRWEGLITTSFYFIFIYFIANKTGAKFIRKLLWAVIIAAGLSSLYGIVQSFGIDIVQWSLDPSQRVFGSINNPVHYCAIMGMALPVIAGQLFHTVKKIEHMPISLKPLLFVIGYYSLIAILILQFPVTNKSILWIINYVLILGSPIIYFFYYHYKNPSYQHKLNLIFTCFLLVLYATFLSYSRATWLGLTASLGLMFTLTSLINLNLNKKELLISVFGSLCFTLSTYLFFIFNLYTISTKIQLLSFIIILVSVLIFSLSSKEKLSQILIIMMIILSHYLQHSLLSSGILVGCLLASIWLKQKQKNTTILKSALFMLCMMNVQFISNSIIEFINFILLCSSIIIIEPSTNKNNIFSTNSIFKWKIIMMGLIGLLIITPTIFNNIQSKIITNSNNNLLIKQASEKINSYKNVAIEGTARTSMWKSAFPWINDHRLFGSGLDTIRFYYPKYRRSEYGKLEGGHNYTPDRLHNEYLNTLATKGIVGFIAFYILFIGGSFTMLLFFMNNEKNESRQYLIIGLICGTLVYLGQVMFNFGVVATLVFFYLFIAAGMGLKVNYENN